MKARTLLFVLLVVVFAAISFTAVAQDVAREDTVIFDVDGPAGAVANYDQMNYLLPDSRRPYGLHQAVMEPLSSSTTKQARSCLGWQRACQAMTRWTSGR